MGCSPRNLGGAVRPWRSRGRRCSPGGQGSLQAPGCSGLWVVGVESPPCLRLRLPGEGSPSHRDEKTVNQKTLERPQRSTQYPQGCRWELATREDCLRRKSHLPSCLRPTKRASSYLRPPAPAVPCQQGPKGTHKFFGLLHTHFPTLAQPSAPSRATQWGPRSLHATQVSKPGPEITGKKGFRLGVWLSPQPVCAPSPPTPCQRHVAIIPPPWAGTASGPACLLGPWRVTGLASTGYRG